MRWFSGNGFDALMPNGLSPWTLTMESLYSVCGFDAPMLSGLLSSTATLDSHYSVRGFDVSMLSDLSPSIPTMDSLCSVRGFEALTGRRISLMTTYLNVSLPFADSVTHAAVVIMCNGHEHELGHTSAYYFHT